MFGFDKSDLSKFVGKRFVFTYNSGWSYELYIKNAGRVDYRVHHGVIGDRWIKNQHVYMSLISKDICKLSWTERTGTNVSIIINLVDHYYQGTLFFPHWIIKHPEKAAHAINDTLPLIELYREAGPTYPIEIVDEFARITFVEDCGSDDETIIACPSSELSKEAREHLKLAM